MLGLPLVVAISIVGLAARFVDRTAAIRSAAAIVAWLALTGALSSLGLFARWTSRPPPLMPSMALMLALTVWLALSRIGMKTSQSVPMAALVGVQAFRLPLEVVMHEAAAEGLTPAQMSWSGLNFDVITGATAIAVASLAATGNAPRWLLLAWNVAGLALVVTVASIGIASTPMFAAFGTDPARVNTWIAWFPFSWLPTFLVPVALAGHLVMLRRLVTDGTPTGYARA